MQGTQRIGKFVGAAVPLPKESRIAFVTTEDQREALDAISRETGAPISEIIRRALAEYLSKHAGVRS